MKNVILSNEHGTPQGTIDILEAHSGAGKLHLAFSIFVFRKNSNEILLQKRSEKKMLWPGYWSNTCCSHPQEGENLEEGAQRRLMEECGFVCPLTVGKSFLYHAQDPSGRGVEYEHDTLLIGNIEEEVVMHPHPDEVAELKWMEVDLLQQEFLVNPDVYTPWLKKGLELILEEVR